MWKRTYIFILVILFGFTGCSNESVEQENDPALQETFVTKDEETAKPSSSEKNKVTAEKKEKANNEAEGQKSSEQSRVKTKEKPSKSFKKSEPKKREEVKVKTKKVEEKPRNAKEKSSNEDERKEAKSQAISVANAWLPNENSEPREKPITHIVLHFSSNAVASPDKPYDAADVRQTFVDNGVSAHYLVDRDGQVYPLVSENRVAYHAGKGSLADYPAYKDKLNHYSIGIEMMAIGTKEEMSTMMSGDNYDKIDDTDIGYTDAQYEAVGRLIDEIVTTHPEIDKDRKNIIGHDEYAPDRKTDPGSLFDWSKIGL